MKREHLIDVLFFCFVETDGKLILDIVSKLHIVIL